LLKRPAEGGQRRRASRMAAWVYGRLALAAEKGMIDEEDGEGGEEKKASISA